VIEDGREQRIKTSGEHDLRDPDAELWIIRRKWKSYLKAAGRLSRKRGTELKKKKVENGQVTRTITRSGGLKGTHVER